jgi:hypothetical protein
MEPNTRITFTNVASVDEAKQKFMEVVEFLKRQERFTTIGTKIAKGVLLIGPLGTKKTLFAKAIVGEVGVPFLFNLKFRICRDVCRSGSFMSLGFILGHSLLVGLKLQRSIVKDGKGYRKMDPQIIVMLCYNNGLQNVF